MTILFLGHSLVEFFDWQARFPGHNVANLGVAGESVEGLLSRVAGITEKYPSADLVFIMTGINNVAMEDFEFFGSYRDIIRRLSSAYPSARMFVHSLLPTLLDFIPDGAVRRVNESLMELAADTGVEYLDIYSLFIDERGTAVAEYLLDDGIHLSDKGYDVWSKAVEEIVGNT